MDKLIKQSSESRIPIFMSTEYECQKIRQMADYLGYDIPVPLHARAVWKQNAEVILGKPAEKILEDLFTIKVI